MQHVRINAKTNLAPIDKIALDNLVPMELIVGVMETQEKIAGRIGITQSYFSALINGKKRPSWMVAKKLAEYFSTSPALWMDGTRDEIKAALTLKRQSACPPESARANPDSSCFAQ